MRTQLHGRMVVCPWIRSPEVVVAQNVMNMQLAAELHRKEKKILGTRSQLSFSSFSSFFFVFSPHLSNTMRTRKWRKLAGTKLAMNMTCVEECNVIRIVVENGRPYRKRLLIRSGLFV